MPAAQNSDIYVSEKKQGTGTIKQKSYETTTLGSFFHACACNSHMLHCDNTIIIQHKSGHHP